MQNKRPFILLIILIIGLIILKTSGRWDSLVAENICIQGQKLEQQGQYELAEQKYIEAVKIVPNYLPVKNCIINFYRNQLNKYYTENNYEKATYYGEKLIINNIANADDYFTSADCYRQLNNHEKAVDCLKKGLIIRPNDLMAQADLKEEQLNVQINNIRIMEKAPDQIYSLIKTDLTDVVEEVRGILDLVWSVSEGRIMLKTLWRNQIPIEILQADHNGLTRLEYINGKANVLSVEVPVAQIYHLNDKTLTAQQRIYYMNVFMHEFGHAFFAARSPISKNSLEEEMGVDMLGYNIAYKIITGDYMTLNDVQRLSPAIMQALLSDDHKDLPVFSDFNEKIKDFGIFLPYPEVYSDLPAIYKQLLSDGAVSHVPNLDAMIK